MADQAPALALYPVYLYEEGLELPEKGTYYLVTKTGIYLHKQTKVGDALVKVEGIPWLKTPSVDFRLKLPKVPARIVNQALTFFRKVWNQHRSEAYVTLLYSSKLKQYRLWCPKQEVSGGSVNYDRTDQPSFEDRHTNDWSMAGTIHSHCNFSAFHSGTDEHDESTFDGIHITLGHVDKPQISMASSIAINNKRETLEPENACAGVVRVENKEVTRKSYMSWGDTYYFDIELSEAEAQAAVRDAELIDSEWMPKVSKRDFGFSKKNGGSYGSDLFSEDHWYGNRGDNWIGM